MLTALLPVDKMGENDIMVGSRVRMFNMPLWEDELNEKVGTVIAYRGAEGNSGFG